MASVGNTKTNLDVSEAFLQYEEEIANHPAYSGMPDLRHEDGTIQWEAPSNRGGGEFQFSHDKRLRWWENKATEVGISTDEDRWISKVAKLIHPTKLHPCKVCGRVMDIRYCYLSTNFMKRVTKLPFYANDIPMDETTHILDFVSTFVDTYGDQAYLSLPSLLKCSKVPEIPSLPNNLNSWIIWIQEKYIPNEPNMLGPGTMSNPPDRLDGFHTYNRCCRTATDKGRSKENLASYSTDRRAFENWSDGNWITANKLMGYISSNQNVKQEKCANDQGEGKHPRPCSADHIGPISLGFCHRPEFQLLCSPCNSAKNNRMYYSDVLHLKIIEEAGERVTTWYADPIWQKCKNKVSDKDTALRLSRVMRDNRNIAMMLLADFVKAGEFLFLLTLLNLDYADYEYSIREDTVSIKDHIITADFLPKKSSLRYVSIQKTRKIRVAYSALIEYVGKENRNGYQYTDTKIDRLKSQAFALLKKVSQPLKEKNTQLIGAIEGTDSGIEEFIKSLDYKKLVNDSIYTQVREILTQIMNLVGIHLESMWDNTRYSRDVDE